MWHPPLPWFYSSAWVSSGYDPRLLRGAAITVLVASVLGLPLSSTLLAALLYWLMRAMSG